MNMMQKVFAAANALKAGESLQDPAKWKSVQLLMNPFLLIIGTLFQFLDIGATDAQINMVSAGLATIAVLLNTYFTKATSTKV
jgi:hypothetical protein